MFYDRWNLSAIYGMELLNFVFLAKYSSCYCCVGFNHNFTEHQNNKLKYISSAPKNL